MHPTLVSADRRCNIVRRRAVARRLRVEVAGMLAVTVHLYAWPTLLSAARMAEPRYESVKHKRLAIEAACGPRHALIGGRVSEKSQAALAQLVEHIIRNDGVACSSHASGTTPN
jgi:hypothetical protein